MPEATRTILDSLGPFPILQFWAGLAVTAACAYFAWKGLGQSRDRPTTGAGGVEMYVDGPVVQLYAEMRRIAVAAEKAAGAVPDIGALRDEFATKASEGRHAIYDRIQGVVKTFEDDLEKIEARIRAMEQSDAARAEQIRNLEARAPGRRGT